MTLTYQQLVSFKGYKLYRDVKSSSFALGQYVISGNHSPLDDHSGDGFIHIHDVRTPSAVIKAYTGHEDVNVVRMRFVKPQRNTLGLLAHCKLYINVARAKYMSRVEIPSMKLPW